MDRGGWDTNPRPVIGPTTGREKQKKRPKSSAGARLKGLEGHNKQCWVHSTGDRLSSKDNEGLKAVLQENKAHSGKAWLPFLEAHSTAGNTR